MGHNGVGGRDADGGAGWSDAADGGACEVSMAKYSGIIGINREESRDGGEAKASTQNQGGEIFGIDRD